MKLFKRAQKGFTLVELMVVMAVIAVLAAVVVPPVTGTNQASKNSQVVQDASSIQTIIGSFAADQNLAENIIPVAGSNVTLGATQEWSNKWPEGVLTVVYDEVFASVNVTAVIIQDKEGDAVAAYTGHTDLFAETYNGLDFAQLTAPIQYLQTVPANTIATFSTAKPYHNYLYLLKKVTVTGSSDIRELQVYVLTTVTTSGTDTLTYKRVF